MRKILAIFMLFAGLNLAAGEKMQNLKAPKVQKLS